MLILGLSVGKERYGIDATSIVEVVPYIQLKKVPLTEDSIKGIFNYRGIATPVIDLCQLFEQHNSNKTFSTRIIIIEYHDKSGATKPIGLVANNVTDVMQCEIDNLSNSGIQSGTNNFLGLIYKHNDEMIQLINTANILPESISSQLE